jgi:hypothetical protein
MAQIQGELQRMLDAVRTPQSVESAEMIAEEIATRCNFTKQYDWDDGKSAAIVETPAGVKLELRGDESKRVIHITMNWGLPGVHGRQSVGKWIRPATEAASGILRKAGWEITEEEFKYASIRIAGHLTVTKAAASLDQAAETIDRATSRLRFD